MKVPAIICAALFLISSLINIADAARISMQQNPLGNSASSSTGASRRARHARWYKRYKDIQPSGSVGMGAKTWEPQTFEEIKQSLLAAAAFDGRSRDAQQKDGNAPDPAPVDPHFCYSRKYRKRTLKLVRNAPFIGLFSDLKNFTDFEGSSVTYAKGAYWVVYDSLRALGKVDLHFQFRGDENKLVPEDAGESESQFEGLQYSPSTDTFLAVRESARHTVHGLVPLIEELKVADDESSWSLTSACPVHFKLEDENKGWEGLTYWDGDNGDRMIFGLCESNFCETIHGVDPPGLRRGNGRLVLAKRVENKANGDGGGDDDKDECYWEVQKVIHLPKEAYFMDYAGIAFFPHPHGRRVSVVSQEDAAVWVGEFDWDKMEFVPGGHVFHFPRDSDCNKIFCNVEGLTWLDHQRLIFASDRSKSTQDYACMANDQSLHIMALPK